MKTKPSNLSSTLAALLIAAIGITQAPTVLAQSQFEEELSRYHDTDSPRERFEILLQGLRSDQETPQLSEVRRYGIRGLLSDNAFFSALSILENGGSMSQIYSFADEFAPFAPTLADFNKEGYDGTFDSYPAFLGIVGAAHCQESDYVRCHMMLTRAKDFSDVQFVTSPRSDFERMIRSLEEYLKEYDPLAPGAYVTNKGLIQNWIGRVRERKNGNLVVTITYARKGFGLEKRQPTTVDAVQVKPLGAVSVDAVLKGYFID